MATKRSLRTEILAALVVTAACGGTQQQIQGGEPLPTHKLTLLAASTPDQGLLEVLRSRMEALGLGNPEFATEGTSIQVSWSGDMVPEKLAPYLTTKGAMGIHQVVRGPRMEDLSKAFDASPHLTTGILLNEERWTGPSVTPERALEGYASGTRSQIHSTQKLAVLQGKDPGRLLEVVNQLAPPSAGTKWVAMKYSRLNWMTLNVRSQAVVSHRAVVSAEATKTAEGWSAVWAEFSREGTEEFRRHTSENVGGRICVLVDDAVFSCPVIMEPIATGRLQLTLPRDAGDVDAIATALVYGPLPTVVVAAE